MDIQNCCKDGKRCCCAVLAAIIGIFLVTLIVAKIIEIQDKIKETGNTIMVSDTGEIYAKPDLALTTFSVVKEAKTVGEALSENTKKMNAVISFVKGEGIEDKDVKTTNFNISPRYEWYEESQCYPPCPGGKRVLVGYEVTQSLEVKIRDMTKIGDIIQGATDAGANEVGDLQFTIDKEDELKAQARTEAITKAKTKAKDLASQLGVKLGRIISFNESNQLPYYYGYSMKEAASSAIGGGTPSIETGENKIEVTVTITYEIH